MELLKGQLCSRNVIAVLVVFSLSVGTVSEAEDFIPSPEAKYIILMISDGWGIKHIEATGKYTGHAPVYQSWDMYWMSTFPAGGSYDPDSAWSDFDYLKSGATDSSASATALYTGLKTKPSMLSVSTEGQRLFTIAEKARMLYMAVGAVSTVQISHATPGAWYAHNDYRFNSYAIAEEGLFGDPQATYDKWDWNQRVRHFAQTVFKWLPRSRKVFKDLYSGDYGPSQPVDVLIGADGTGYSGESYLNDYIREKLRKESSQPDKHIFIESVGGEYNGVRLMELSENSNITRLVGIFGHSYRLADGSGYNPENPTLAEMTASALTVLVRNPNGFVLLVEGGAVDYVGHDNNMDRLIGEQAEFDEAVQAVVDWVEDPSNGSNWNHTLVIVTGDHETGYLTAGPGVFPNQPLGEVSGRTVSLEKEMEGSCCRASWEDGNENNMIDNGETVYWAWNTTGHTNNLVPLYAKGLASGLFANYAINIDPIRGPYIDNTDVHKVMDAVITATIVKDERGIEMVVIPAGEFWMGCDNGKHPDCLDHEEPLRSVYVDTFAIDKTEVSVSQYGECVKSDYCDSENLDLPYKHGVEQKDLSDLCNWGEEGRENHPINCVDWFDAKSYCEWANKRLPSEVEWEKAARGTDGRVFPWGNQGFAAGVIVANIGDESAKLHDSKLTTVKGYDDGFYTTSPVGAYPRGASPYGVLDTVGNVWEWTGDACDFKEKQSFMYYVKIMLSDLLSISHVVSEERNGSKDYRCDRGGSWKNSHPSVYHRAKDAALNRFTNVGFRCAK